MWTLSGFIDEIDPDVEIQCRVASGVGLRFVELRSAWGVNLLDLTAEQLDEVERVLVEHGLKVSSIGSPIGKIGIDEDFEPHLARMRHAAALARRFGAPFIRLFSFLVPSGEDPDDHRDEVLRRMEALAGVAEEWGVTAIHENEVGVYGDIPRRCHDLVASVDSPHLRHTWDPANFVQVGVRPLTDAYALLRPALAYIQIKDAHLGSGEVDVAGGGDGELPETIRALRADGYDGFFSLEPHLDVTVAYGRLSGPDRFTAAWRAFTDLLDAQGIAYDERRHR